MLDESGNLSKRLSEEKPKGSKIWDVLLGMIIGVVILCCLVGAGGAAFFYFSQNGGLPSFGGQSQAAEATPLPATATLELLPTATLIPTATPEGLLVFDDFTTTGNGLPIQKDDDKLLSYTDIGYRMAVYTPKRLIWAPLERNFGDVRIEVDISRVAGPIAGDVGVICRLQGDDNFYAFLISGDGQYAVVKYINDFESFVGMEDRQVSEHIRRGNVKNHITAECAGSVLRLYVNDNLLIETTDASLQSSGGVALAAGTRDNPGVDAVFNNLEVHLAAP
ncbi:MAG: hypothetical protein JXB38_15520 [Anaerolineales bacterium]|nr:hypothetical protein [Anaerolineales bacterium]